MEPHQIIETQKRIIDTISYEVKDAIIITDPNRVITHFNKAAEEMTGYSVVEVISKKIDDVLQLSDENGKITPDEVCPIGEFDIEGTVYEALRIRLKTKNGEEKIVCAKTTKVKGGHNVNLGCILFIENTFEKSELERMKLDFVSMSEHVLRTPITVIRGYISRLLEEKTTSKLEDSEINYLNSAFLGTTELLSLVEGLLNMAEFRKGTVKVETHDIHLEELVTKVVQEFSLVAEQKGLRVVFIPPLEKLPMVKADVEKIKIVLNNLIENAVKYSQEGKIHVTLLNKGDFVEIAVKDNGRGIPQEYISQLFTKFYRVKKALEMEYGMGLGLYMSRKIIDAHGGKIWVTSEEGVGSTFYFTLETADKPQGEENKSFF